MKKLFYLLLLVASQLQAATYYIAPAGSDTNPGTTGSPYKTFAYALAAIRFNAGDTLILKNGTYTRTANGNGTRIINVRCDTGTNNNGTVSLPITIKAENERQAYLQGDGTGSVISTYACSYWSFEGIRASSADLNVNIDTERFAYVYLGNHVSFKRNLLTNNNRYRNEAPLVFDQSPFALAEENEIYYFHRNGIGFVGGSNNSIARRNYSNSRSYNDLGWPGTVYGRVSHGGAQDRGDESITLYPASNCIIENNILEGDEYAVALEAASAAGGGANNNKVLGNIAINQNNGFYQDNRANGALVTWGTPTNNHWENNVSVDARGYGFYLRSSYQTYGTNNTSIHSGNGTYAGYGFAWDEQSSSKCYALIGGVVTNQCSFYFDNSLIFNNGNWGNYLSTLHYNWLLDYANSWNNTNGNYYPVTDANRTHSTSVDPQMGGCKVWIPATSPMKSAGKVGADIGANILYQYLNGVLTSVPLWNPITNKFSGQGAIVAGVNDIAGSSLSNVDARLNINQNGCAFPNGYGGVSTSGGSWISLDTFDSYTVGADLSGGAGGSGWAANWTQNVAAVTIAAMPGGPVGNNAAFVNNDPTFSYSRTFADLTKGIVSFEFIVSTTSITDSIFFTFDEGTGGTAARGIISVDPDGFVKIFDGTTRTNIGAYTPNVKQKVTVEFDDTAQPNAFRAKLNAGVFSQWYPAANGGAYSVINRFRVFSVSGTFTGQLYFDNIQEGSASSLISAISVIDSGLSSQGFYIGTSKTLGWASTDLSGNIDLRLSRNDRLTYETIASGVPNTGTYNWIVSGPSCIQCNVRICSSVNTTLCDDSATFRIFGPYLR